MKNEILKSENRTITKARFSSHKPSHKLDKPSFGMALSLVIRFRHRAELGLADVFLCFACAIAK
jgi:hypothetical protein